MNQGLNAGIGRKRIAPSRPVTAEPRARSATRQRLLLRYIAPLAVLIVAAIFTGLNMFHYPHYESDEGTYLGSAWAMFQQGKLSYYTYTYDHPPLGWFLIGLWVKLIGGFARFGMSINGGRVLMLLVTLASTLLIFGIVRRATGRTAAAIFGATLFAVSPLAVGLHRQVWLDNIATLWLLLALYLLVSADGRMSRIFWSALAFGLMFWTKEVFVVLLPGLLFLAVAQARPGQRRFTGALWATATLATVSFFVLLALLKDELLPPGVLWSSSDPHVSLIDTLLFQAGRGGGGSMLQADSQFQVFWNYWSSIDPLLMTGGLAAAAVGLLAVRRDRVLAGIALMLFTYLLFLGRGGVVLFYYVIPLIALMALALGLLAGNVLQILGGWRRAQVAGALGLFAATVGVGADAARANSDNFRLDSTSSQRAAAQWMAANLPHDSMIIMDSFPWVDLRDPAFTKGQPFENAHYYWPALSDDAIREGMLYDNWRNIDYLAISPSTEADVKTGTLPLIPEALEHADKFQTFASGKWSVSLWRVRELQERTAPSDPILANAWTSYVERFVDDGRVVDPTQNRLTTSEGQSYALLRAVYMNDQATFDRVWRWTEQNLQRPDGLMAWKWGAAEDGSEGVLDPASATDAEQDTALALLFAAKQWDTPRYQEAAQRIIGAIWEQETVAVADRRVLVAGDWARGDSPTTSQPIVNPSYFAPYAYRIFAEVDPAHPWMEVVDSSYDVLSRVQADPNFGGKAGLVPNWVALDPTTGELGSATAMGDAADQFSFDASRTQFRLALDWIWFKDDRAKQALEALRFPRAELERSGRLAAGYALDGTPTEDFEATSTYAGVIPGLLFGGDRDLAHKVFAEKLLSAYHSDEQGTYWGSPDNYYDQNWAWFTTALMDGALTNVWAGQQVIEWDEVLYD